MLIDTHSHIYSEDFDADRAETIQRAKEVGVNHIILPNCDSSTLAPMLALEAEYPGYCHAAIGLHPTSVKEDYEFELALVKSELEVVEWNDLKSGHYQAALDDLYKIKSNWGELYNSANTLSNVSFTWQDTDGNWHNFGAQNPSQNNSKVNYIQAN